MIVWKVVGDLAKVVQAAENRRFRMESCRRKGETKRVGGTRKEGGIDVPDGKPEAQRKGAIARRLGYTGKGKRNRTDAQTS